MFISNFYIETLRRKQRSTFETFASSCNSKINFAFDGTWEDGEGETQEKFLFDKLSRARLLTFIPGKDFSCRTCVSNVFFIRFANVFSNGQRHSFLLISFYNQRLKPVVHVEYQSTHEKSLVDVDSILFLSFFYIFKVGFKGRERKKKLLKSFSARQKQNERKGKINDLCLLRMNGDERWEKSIFTNRHER